MIVQNTIPTGLRLFAAVFATTATIILTSPVVAAQGTTATGSIDAVATANKAATARSKAAHAAGAYYIEFRSRYAQSYGHTFAMFGRLNARGQIVEREVAGLHPAGDSPVPWMIGHLVFVPSETGPSDGDLEEKYVSARYRVVLSESEYPARYDIHQGAAGKLACLARRHVQLQRVRCGHREVHGLADALIDAALSGRLHQFATRVEQRLNQKRTLSPWWHRP